MEHGVIHHPYPLPRIHGRVALLAGHVIAWIGVEDVAGHPPLDRRAAIRAVDYAHRGAEDVREGTGEEIREGRELGGIGGRRDLPCADGALLGGIALELGDIGHAYAGIASRVGYGLSGSFDGLYAESAQGHLHIALARAEPDLAGEDIADGHGVLAV